MSSASPPQFGWIRRYGWALALLILGTFFFSALLTGPSFQGKPAPAFRAPVLGGGMADLEQHRNKEVVVLNFWATWCPGCAQELPALNALAHSLSGKPVQFYACNVAETPALVQEYLKEAKLDLPVVLDESGALAGQFQVSALPMTFIIGPDGVVRQQYAGYAPGLELEMRQQILALL